MSFKSKIISIVVTLMVIGAGLVGYTYPHNNKSQREVQLETEMTKIKAQEEEDNRLGQYVLNMMSKVGAGKRLSEAKQQVLARAIVRVSNDIFESYDHKKAFVAVLAIESGFNRTAQSPTGPKGYGQLAKSAFKEGMQNCSSPNVDEEDVWETDLNLAGAGCYFRMLLEKHNGDPYIAIVSYNQGANSDASKSYAKTGSMDNVEALKYVAKFSFLKRNVTEEKTKDAPKLTEVSKSVKKVSHGK